jgi:hypothetical protein
MASISQQGRKGRRVILAKTPHPIDGGASRAVGPIGDRQGGGRSRTGAAGSEYYLTSYLNCRILAGNGEDLPLTH